MDRHDKTEANRGALCLPKQKLAREQKLEERGIKSVESSKGPNVVRVNVESSSGVYVESEVLE